MGQNHGVGSRGETRQSSFNDLSEFCISNILSFTSPRDACVVALVSKTFNSAAMSDVVWEKFLPPDYYSLVPQSRVFSSKKELYLALCDDSVPMEDGKKCLWLEKSTGKRCIMLSKKPVIRTMYGNPWSLHVHPFPEARFEKIAEVSNECLFEAHGKMSTRYLSPRTRYSVYIVFKTKSGYPKGFWDGGLPIEGTVALVGYEPFNRFLYFVEPSNGRKQREKERTDGWMEAELGDFFNKVSCDDAAISDVEIKGSHWKRGLIIRGMELRPVKCRKAILPWNKSYV